MPDFDSPLLFALLTENRVRQRDFRSVASMFLHDDVLSLNRYMPDAAAARAAHSGPRQNFSCS